MTAVDDWRYAATSRETGKKAINMGITWEYLLLIFTTMFTGGRGCLTNSQGNVISF